MDLALAIPLFLLETAWLVLDWMFGLGMEVWAAQGDRERIDTASLAHTERMWVLLVAVLLVAVLAGIFRARWTLIAHLLVALLAGGGAGDRTAPVGRQPRPARVCPLQRELLSRCCLPSALGGLAGAALGTAAVTRVRAGPDS
ncbi:DUF6234 family protein [Streptomyces sp. NPDC001657]|uniref:DUF6234 family protein n=1 Tax=Streptomyces sp. NPDC001657 TaxID=3154522 RepID=UPI00332EFF9A